MNTQRFKYESTPHLPFSPTQSRDDSVLKNTDHFQGKEVVVTLKRDGENTSLYCDGFHARSLDSRHHESRDWIAAFHATIAHEIPVGWRVCGENLYAQHSIVYNDLPSYFMGFSIWDETNTALDWDSTLEYFEMLGIVPVPEVYRGLYDEARIKAVVKGLDTSKEEGIVIRTTGRIPYAEFSQHLAKWVRQGHVQTDKHWMHRQVIPNGLAGPDPLKRSKLGF